MFPTKGAFLYCSVVELRDRLVLSRAWGAEQGIAVRVHGSGAENCITAPLVTAVYFRSLLPLGSHEAFEMH